MRDGGHQGEAAPVPPPAVPGHPLQLRLPHREGASYYSLQFDTLQFIVCSFLQFKTVIFFTVYSLTVYNFTL